MFFIHSLGEWVNVRRSICGSQPTNQPTNQPSNLDRPYLLLGAGDEVLGVAQEALVLVVEDGDGENEEGVDLYGRLSMVVCLGGSRRFCVSTHHNNPYIPGHITSNHSWNRSMLRLISSTGMMMS